MDIAQNRKSSIDCIVYAEKRKLIHSERQKTESHNFGFSIDENVTTVQLKYN